MPVNNIKPIQDEIVLYQSEDGNVKVDVLFQDETVWLTQEQMAQLFGKGRTAHWQHFQRRRIGRREGMSEIPTYHSKSKGEKIRNFRFFFFNFIIKTL